MTRPEIIEVGLATPDLHQSIQVALANMPVQRARAATMRASFSLSAVMVARPVGVCPIISVPSVLQ